MHSVDHQRAYYIYLIPSQSRLYTPQKSSWTRCTHTDFTCGVYLTQFSVNVGSRRPRSSCVQCTHVWKYALWWHVFLTLHSSVQGGHTTEVPGCGARTYEICSVVTHVFLTLHSSVQGGHTTEVPGCGARTGLQTCRVHQLRAGWHHHRAQHKHARREELKLLLRGLHQWGEITVFFSRYFYSRHRYCFFHITFQPQQWHCFLSRDHEQWVISSYK